MGTGWQSWPPDLVEPTQASLPSVADACTLGWSGLDACDSTAKVEATGAEAEDSGQDGRAFSIGGANQQLARQAVQVQASHRQERRPRQLEDLTAPRTVWLHPEHTLTVYETIPSDAQFRDLSELPGTPPKPASLTFRAESNEPPGLDWQPQPRLPIFYHEDGDASMLVATGASQPPPFDHARPHDAPSAGPLSPVQTAAAAMDRAADSQPAAPDAPAATAAPALPDFASKEGAQSAGDVNPAATASAPAGPTATITTAAAAADTATPNGLPAPDAPISLAQPLDMGLAMDMSNMAPMPLHMDLSGLGMAPDLMPMDLTEQDIASDERVNAFARLRFDDGSYYMHTYQIILGRNLALARKDMKRLQKVSELEKSGDLSGAHALLHGKKRKRNGRGAPSVISEKGGIVSARIDSMPLAYQQRRQPSQSASSGSHNNGEAAEEKPAERAPQDVIMQAFPERPDQFDGHIPEDPNDCPLVPIHPEHVTARTGNAGPKGISRRHAKIFYNFEEGAFCIEVLGNNGLHHEGQFCPQGAVVPLEHGDNLSIGAVNIQFFLPDVALTEQQRQRQESGSRPMSFSFENGNGEMESDEEMSSDSEGQMSINPRQVYYHPVDSDIDSEEDANDDMDEYEEPAPKQKIKIKLKAPRPREPSPPPKKSKKQKAIEKKRKREREREREREEEEEHSPYESPLKKIKKIRPPQEESVRASPTKEPKASKEVKQAKEVKEKVSEPVKESKEPKESKESKEKGKAPAKAPSKTPVPDEATPDFIKKETPVKEQPAPVKSVPTDSPPLLRKPLEAEIEAGGDIEGLITQEMADRHSLPQSLVGQIVEKRKGPGRPPKDGIMSKRQRSQLIKQAKEIERARAAGIDPADIPAPSIKPKVTKRKDSNAGDVDGDDVLESTEKGDGTLLGDKAKQKQPIKPPRTPSPEMRIEDYTEEQLQRPSANYVVLIHEAISSSPTGQMNLQQIYNYIEKKYPWYKFKTTTSGWQSSVRHNLGQHDAFVKGDKEGKGFNWRINPEVSIEKERRKRQVSPPVNHAQRPQYYPPPNGYPPYPPQPGYPYHPGMPPPGMPPAPPRLPPSMMASAPRLPPSLARDANASTPAASQGAPPPSPYASPWAGGNTAGSPSAAMPPRPYPQPPHGPPQAGSAAGPSGQYGVLYPTSAPPSQGGHAAASPYGGPYAAAGASPYAAAPGRSYAPYPPQGYPQPGASGPSPQGPPQNAAFAGPPAGPGHPPAAPPSQSPAQPQSHPPSQAQPGQAPQPSPAPPTVNITPDIIARYPANTNHNVIRNLEMFRSQYVKLRTEPGEDTKVDNAIKAFIDTSVPQSSLTDPERDLLTAITKIPNLAAYRANPVAVNQENAATQLPVSSTAAAGTAAAIAAAGAASTNANSPPNPQHQQGQHQPPPQTPQQPSQQAPHTQQQASQQATPSAIPVSVATAPATPGPPTSELQKSTPNTTAAPAPAPQASNTSLPSAHRPSVEPLTPVPGSPAIQTGTPLVKRSITEMTVADLAGEDGETPGDAKPADSAE
ncbi:forkhead domain-containing protein [Stagonosporopsis vannaccii]|nr:forkhead domain-containing protein [Stagonosporopsis vannaccii]